MVLLLFQVNMISLHYSTEMRFLEPQSTLQGHGVCSYGICDDLYKMLNNF